MNLTEFENYWKEREKTLKKCKIYKITNTKNNKCYIGFTSRPIIERFKEHINYIQNGSNGSHIHNAIVKYGFDKFTFEILEDSDDEVYLCETREDYWITYYNSIKTGYNACPGGSHPKSTKNTHIYNNGINQLFIKEGNKVPEGFIPGALPKSQNTLLGMASKEYRPKTIPYNKGKDKTDPIVALNAENARQTTIKTGVLKGANNPRALPYLIIDPFGNSYDVTGVLKKFANEHDLSYVTLRDYCNKGLVPKLSKYCTSKQAHNTTGWELRLLNDENAVIDATIKRLKLKQELDIKEFEDKYSLSEVPTYLTDFSIYVQMPTRKLTSDKKLQILNRLIELKEIDHYDLII